MWTFVNTAASNFLTFSGVAPPFHKTLRRGCVASAFENPQIWKVQTV